MRLMNPSIVDWEGVWTSMPDVMIEGFIVGHNQSCKHPINQWLSNWGLPDNSSKNDTLHLSNNFGICIKTKQLTR